jgi:hypothetical protein
MECLTDGNTAFGDDALINISNIGFDNTAIGFEALLGNTIGGSNTAIGFAALSSNTTGLSNTATGSEALLYNTIGSDNTAIGHSALLYNTGNQNTAVGDAALLYNTTGNDNTALGTEALFPNTSGHKNTATGALALDRNTTGFSNTANGFDALSSNTTGGHNIALGRSAGSSLTTGNYNIDIGNFGVAGESRVMRLGTEGEQSATYIAGIATAPLATGAAVTVGITPTGQLGVRASSARFKEAIKPMEKASEAILSLHPVSFRYKKTLGPQGVPQFGLVAEEVAKVDPDLVQLDSNGKPLTVRYDEVNAMLLNEFLKEHRKVEEQGHTIAEQQTEIRALAAQLQRVSTEIKLLKATPRVVDNP